jgi:hypothetical protein
MLITRGPDRLDVGPGARAQRGVRRPLLGSQPTAPAGLCQASLRPRALHGYAARPRPSDQAMGPGPWLLNRLTRPAGVDVDAPKRKCPFRPLPG